jgi:polysaccharide export outer membrane protein
MSKRNRAIVLGTLLILGAPPAPAQDNSVPPSQPTKQRLEDQKPLPGAPSSIDRPVLQERDWRYQLRPGDVFEVTFPFTPEFNEVITIQPDGYATLRGVGDVRITGETLPQLRQLLYDKYKGIVREQTITVELKDFDKPYFVVDGEVGRPGKYDLRGEPTVTQAIAIAGGVKETAKHSEILLFRRVSDNWVSAQTINLKKMLAEGNLSEDPYLRPGDMLFVPKNAISKIKPFLPISSLGAYVNPAVH